MKAPAPVHFHALIAEDSDLCVCGALLCPDTLKPVFYNTTHDPKFPSYFHVDGTTCFLHATRPSPEPDIELFETYQEYAEFISDNEDEPYRYSEFLNDQITNSEQIWLEEPRERDLTEAYLLLLRKEKEKYA